MKRLVNGKWVNLPQSNNDTYTVEEVKKAAKIPKDRAIVLQIPGGDSQLLSPGNSFVFPDHAEAIDVPSHKRGLRAPSRVFIKHLKDLSCACPIDVDDDYSYVVIHDVKLTPGYNRSRISILIEIPSDYPLSPPGVGNNRIYLPKEIRYQGKELRDLHEFTNFRENSEWCWLCYEYIKWDPNWDDLTTLLEMIRADLRTPKTKMFSLLNNSIIEQVRTVTTDPWWNLGTERDYCAENDIPIDLRLKLQMMELDRIFKV